MKRSKLKTKLVKKYTVKNGICDEEHAQLYGEQISTIIKSEGAITPTRLVEEATPRDNVFHNYFEWNNIKAGEEYRLQQARDLINHIVEVTEIEGEMVEHRSFFNVHDVERKGKVYVTLMEVAENSDYRAQLIQKTQSALKNCMILLKVLRDKL